MWLNRLLQVSQLGKLSLSSFLGRQMSSKLESDVCCRLQVAPSGESYGGLAESNGSLLPGLWRDSPHVTCRLTACTPGSAQRSVTSMGKLYLFYVSCKRALPAFAAECCAAAPCCSA